MFEMDFSEREQGDNAFSQEDQKFLDIVKCGFGHQDGHYEIPLPIRDERTAIRQRTPKFIELLSTCLESPPGYSNFALKTTADDNEAAISSAATEFLRRNFYVDDALKSVASIEEAVELI